MSGHVCTTEPEKTKMSYDSYEWYHDTIQRLTKGAKELL